jgi:uncharacterized protein YjbJ (UPF0337 family)
MLARNCWQSQGDHRAGDRQSRLEAEGKADQVSANIKRAGEKAKDAVKDALD